MSVVLFIVVLVVLIVVHELGHFWVAKWFGIRVDEFGVGYPPRAVVLGRIKETLYTLNWLPFGGFVRIFGEQHDSSMTPEERQRAFIHKPRIVQAVVLAAGIVCNILFAWVLFTATLMLGAPTAIEENQLTPDTDARLIVSTVTVGSPAEVAGLQAGDEIVAVASDAEQLDTLVLVPSDVSAFIKAHAGDSIAITYERNNDDAVVTRTVDLAPAHGVLDATPGVPAVGIGMALVAERALPIHEALVSGFVETMTALANVTVGLTAFFMQAATGSVQWEQIAGPVGIAALVGDASTVGFVYLLYFTAFISINLAVINLLPLPALDGGRLLFVAIEAITNRPINYTVALALNVIGFGLIMLLMIVVTYHDIARLIS